MNLACSSMPFLYSRKENNTYTERTVCIGNVFCKRERETGTS